uniref:C2H2-type domain-containing protein n=1 Tax=Plectus sambesii TaxID=2011161 RepID=A0A914W1J6_9BILA
MLLLPSHIQTIYEDAVFSEHTVMHVPGTSSGSSSSTSQDGAAPPHKKLQVFAKDGAYFALDHNLLKYYQTQEAQGLCAKIPVEVIPRRNIPSFVYEVAFCGNAADDECYYGNDGSDSSSISERDVPAEDVEDVTCAVCNHQFFCTKDLTDHQLLKRHFGCIICGETFSSFKSLQQHETANGHGYWSNDSDGARNAN